MPDINRNQNVTRPQQYKLACSADCVLEFTTNNPSNCKNLEQHPPPISRKLSILDNDLPQPLPMKNMDPEILEVFRLAFSLPNGECGDPRKCVNCGTFQTGRDYWAGSRRCRRCSHAFKMSPLLELPIEMIEYLCGFLDDESLHAFRMINARIADQADYPFRKRFRSMQYTMGGSPRRTAERFDRLRAFGRSYLAKEVESLTFVECDSGRFPILEKGVPGFKDSEIRFFRDEIRTPMIFVRCLKWFPNLKSLTLKSEWNTDRHAMQRLAPTKESFLPLFTSLNQMLYFSKFRPPLHIKIEYTGLSSCEFDWTGSETTDTVSIQCLKTAERVEEDMDQMMSMSGLFTPFYNHDILNYCNQLQYELLGHPIRSLKLSGFVLRIRDLAMMFSMSTILNLPETLVLEQCTLYWNRNLMSRTVEWEWFESLINAFCRDGMRHLAIIDAKCNVGPEEVWPTVFEELRSVRLKSFQFERAERVSFDWDADGKLDDGGRLPEKIRKLGGIAMALMEMEKCIHFQPLEIEEGFQSIEEGFVESPHVLWFEEVEEVVFGDDYDDGDDEEDNENDNENVGAIGDFHLLAFQAFVSHPPHNLRELSIVKCSSYWCAASWIHFFKASENHKDLKTLRFENVYDRYFDWDGDGNLDKGSLLPRIIEELGMSRALDKMIEAYRDPNFD
ncbi:uncharacterized protein IWZ02DRAFT_494865 [Phyllosticta citriasiana]|uniref:uncharacterized protein n=1 Tax=Phyllosticta citriasiana TaxID=595635 RepID=UPI0030FD29D7